MHILIPCKGIGSGKTRLRHCLQPHEHRSLGEYLTARTLATAVAVAGADRVQIVTSDCDAIAVAAGHGVCFLSKTGLGLNADLEAAIEHLLAAPKKPDQILILPIDLPFVDRDALVQMTACRGDIVISPDERGVGTNALLLRPAAFGKFRFCYGSGSFPAHVAAARQHGLALGTFNDWRLSFDIDEPAHYMRWLARTGTSVEPHATSGK